MTAVLFSGAASTATPAICTPEPTQYKTCAILDIGGARWAQMPNQRVGTGSNHHRRQDTDRGRVHRSQAIRPNPHQFLSNASAYHPSTAPSGCHFPPGGVSKITSDIHVLCTISPHYQCTEQYVFSYPLDVGVGQAAPEYDHNGTKLTSKDGHCGTSLLCARLARANIFFVFSHDPTNARD